MTVYVIVGLICFIVGGCLGIVIAALCAAADDGDVDFIEYRTWRD